MKRFFLFVLPLFLLTSSFAQDWIKTGTGLGVEKVRLAVPDFNASTQDAKNADLLKAFNETLWNDLDNAGIFDMVSKSFYPLGQVGTPADVKFEGWSAPPPNAAMLAFGNLGVSGNGMTVQGWLYDVKNVTSPQVLGKQYQDAATNDAARTTAHKFADEIIFRLGGGIAGIAESKIYFVSSRSGHKEIWAMDYDGANQHAVTHLGSISLSPRVSPDGSRIAFSSLTKTGWEILMYSLDLNRLVSFPRFGGTNLSPAWSPDGTKIGLLFFAQRRSRDLRRGRFGSEPEADYVLQRPGRFAGVESQDRRANRLGKRTHGTAAGLHHGSRRHQRAAPHRPGICGVSGVVAEWAIPGGFLDAQVRPGSAGRAGHLHHGHCQQAVGAADSRRRTQRFPVLVAGWTAHHFPVQPGRQPPDMDHAGRWYESEAADLCGRQQSAQLELEVNFVNVIAESYSLFCS